MGDVFGPPPTAPVSPPSRHRVRALTPLRHASGLAIQFDPAQELTLFRRPYSPAPLFLLPILLPILLAFASPCSVEAARDEPGYVESVQRQIVNEIAKMGASGGFWGVYAVDLSTGKPLVNVQGESLFLPASNRKLFSTALALRRLGPEYQFTTRLWAVGSIDEGGVLRGDLILEAAGDPALRPAFLNGATGLSLLSQWAREVSAAGIKKVDGRVVVDCSIYQDPALMPPGWGWDQLMELYGALPSALAINENRVSLKISPGARTGDLCGVEIQPTLESGLSLGNSARTVASSGKNTVKVLRGMGPAALLVIGDLPQGAPPVSLTVPLPDPSTAWSESFGRALGRAGVEFTGPMAVAHRREAPNASGPQYRLLVEHKSPPLSRIVQLTNKDSDNLCAEMLYLAAGARVYGQASYQAAQATESAFLRELKVNTDWVVGEDGCGLGRTDLIAPKAIVQLLAGMTQAPEYEPFLESLPVSGRDGTLSYRMSKDGMQGRVFAKTGTLRDVSALSGYIHRSDGRKIAFSMVSNRFSTRTATIRAVQDRICGILYRAE